LNSFFRNLFAFGVLFPHMNREEALREHVADDLQESGVDCPACESTDFEVDVWGVGEGIRGEEVRAVAVCSSCGARLNVPVDDDVLDKVR
jgi:transcription elongation factor Elf1